jgi:hypothetical protein
LEKTNQTSQPVRRKLELFTQHNLDSAQIVLTAFWLLVSAPSENIENILP